MSEPKSIFPEVQEAADALRNRITLAQAEIGPLKEALAAKEKLIRDWQSAVNALLPGTYQDPFDVKF